MDFFQIVEVENRNSNNAGIKVVSDNSVVADKLGFKKLMIQINTKTGSAFLKIKKQIYYYLCYRKIYNTITDNSIVLLQHPFHHKQIAREKFLKILKNNKKVKYVCMVIDIEELRVLGYNNYYEKEFKTMLEIADALIVHNIEMLQFFLKKGIPKEKIINIESFDYLQNNNNIVEFEKSISFAGNLEIIKCGFIGELSKIKDIKINLYGSNFNNKLLNSRNINYHGSFSPDEITKKLNKGFGLVWDGDSIDTCSGNFGQYLKYNNPHKLSLYLSCGIPVVIWEHAAQARFVKKYNVGICVESLKEAEHIISNMSENDYKILQNSVNKIKPLLCSGYFANKAIKQAIKLLTQ